MSPPKSVHLIFNKVIRVWFSVFAQMLISYRWKYLWSSPIALRFTSGCRSNWAFLPHPDGNQIGIWLLSCSHENKKAKKKQKSNNKTRFRMWSDALQENQNQIPQTESSLQLHHWDSFLHLARMVCPDNEAVSVFRGVPLKPLALVAIPNTHVYIFFPSSIWQFFLKRAIWRFYCQLCS